MFFLGGGRGGRREGRGGRREGRYLIAEEMESTALSCPTTLFFNSLKKKKNKNK